MNKKKQRHHLNPLLKYFCPRIHSLFRKQDIVLLSNSEHGKYHAVLSKDIEFQRLYAEAYELDSERTCSELEFADALDAIWAYWLRKHPQYCIVQ